MFYLKVWKRFKGPSHERVCYSASKAIKVLGLMKSTFSFWFADTHHATTVVCFVSIELKFDSKKIDILRTTLEKIRDKTSINTKRSVIDMDDDYYS